MAVIGTQVPAYTVVDICNMALSMIGNDPISSIDDDDDRAKACKRFYYHVRDEILRSHGWRCAVAYVTLTVDATAPDWKYNYRFPLPADCLRLLELESPSYTYEVVGSYIHTNDVDADLKVKYVKLVSDPGLWDDALKDAIVLKLAGRIACPLKSADRAAKLLSDAESIVRSARATSSAEGNENVADPTSLTACR